MSDRPDLEAQLADRVGMLLAALEYAQAAQDQERARWEGKAGSLDGEVRDLRRALGRDGAE